MSSAAGTVGKFASGMTEVGGQLSAGITAPLVAAGAAALAMAVKVGNVADVLLDLRDQTGLSTDALQEFRHVALVAGVPADTLADAAIKLTTGLKGSGEQSAQLAGALSQLGLSAKDSTGALVPMDKLLPGIIAGLQGMDDTTQRNILAADIFGKSWKDLAPVLSLGADGMSEAREEARKLGLVISGDSLEAADAFRVQWATLKTVLGASAAQIGVALIPALTQLANIAVEHLVPALVATVEFVGRMAEGWSNLAPQTQGFIGIMAGLAAAIGPILLVGGKLITVFMGLNPVTLPLIAAFGAVVLAGVAITENWNVISFEAMRLVDFVKAQFDKLVAVFDRVKAGTDKVVGFFQDMFDVVVGHSIIPDLINAVQGEFGKLDVVMAGAAERAVATTNAAFANIVNPKALRAMDFNVTMDAETLYAAVIRGGEAASTSLTTMAFRTEVANAVTADLTTNWSANVEVARTLADAHRLMEDAERKAAAQAEILAVAAGLVPLPTRNVAEAMTVANIAVRDLDTALPLLTTAVRDAAPTISGFDKVLGGLGGVASNVGGFFGNLGQSAMSVVSKFTPMGLATEVIGKVMENLEPALTALEPIITILARVIAAALMPVLKMLFPVIKILAIAFTYLLEVAQRVAQGWLFVVGHVVKTIGKLIDALPFVSGEGIIKAGEALLNTSRELGEAASAMSDERDLIRELRWPDEARDAAEKEVKAIIEGAAIAAANAAEQNEVLFEIRDAIRNKDFSPVINVTTGGSGGLTSGGNAGGAGTLTQLDQALGTLGIRRHVLLTGDNGI